MGLKDAFLSIMGLDDGAVDRRPVSEMLAPSIVMEKEWARAARANAAEFFGMTRGELGREFGARWFPEALPADRDERRSVVERMLLLRSRTLYAEHLDRVQDMFALSDAEIRSRLTVDVEDLPPASRAEERAAAISLAVVREDEAHRDMDAEAREAEEGRMGKARTGGSLLADPTLREIALTVVDRADRWEQSGQRDLTAGPIRLDAEVARRLRLSAATYEPGRRRDVTLVEAYLQDCVARSPRAMDGWSKQALEVMTEGPAYMAGRYGVDTDGLSVRQVVSLEAAHEVASIRASREMPDKGLRAASR